MGFSLTIQVRRFRSYTFWMYCLLSKSPALLLSSWSFSMRTRSRSDDLRIILVIVVYLLEQLGLVVETAEMVTGS